MGKMRLFSTLIVAATLVSLGCGSSEVTERLAQRSDSIVGGYLDEDMENDAVVLVYAKIPNFAAGGLCTGALIAPNVVLTARHCVSQTNEIVTCKNDVKGDLEPTDLMVLRGHDATFNQQGFLSRGKHVFHDHSMSLCGHDLALIVLEQDDVTGPTSKQPPIVPMRVRVDRGPEIDELFSAVGYGLTNPNDMTSAGKRYRRDGVRVLRFERDTDENDFVGTQSICMGDSGGPAISEENAVFGVTSRGQNCFNDQNIWTRTDRFKGLIDEAMQVAGTTYTGEDGTVYNGFGAVNPSSPIIPCPNGICEDSLQCVEGFHGRYCTQTCNPEAPDCAKGWECSSLGYCFLNESCQGQDDCAEGMACVNDGTNYCTPICDPDQPCPSGFTCAQEHGVCFKDKVSVFNPGSNSGCSVGLSTGASPWLLLLLSSWVLARRRRSIGV